MDFVCFVCKKYFCDSKQIVNHLKCIHFIRDGTSNINCVVSHIDGYKCDKKYKTFASLKSHMKECVLKRPQKAKSTDEVIFLNDCFNKDYI